MSEATAPIDVSLNDSAAAESTAKPTAAEAATATAALPAPATSRYQVGTLTYTRMGLLMMFLWMLWGDLVWTLMERVFPSSMPLQLQRLNVPVAWIAVMMGTFTQVINTAMVPIISFRSDRTRTRWGRRIPYIFCTLPFLCVFLAILGFSDSIGHYIEHSAWPQRLGLSPVVLIVIVMGTLILLYDLFNVFVNSVYWYLFADVIPVAFLGRFMAAFRLVGIGAGALYSTFIFGKVETHTREIYVGGAILYFLGIGLMCFRVREGQYPPPNDEPQRGGWFHRVIESAGVYFRECFRHPMYICFYLANTALAICNAVGFAYIFFYRTHLGFSLDAIGKLDGLLAIVAMVVALPLGWLVDKIHPMRAILLTCALMIPTSFAGYYMDSFVFYIAIAVIRMPIGNLMDAATIPLMIRLMPRRQYGQFCSANAMVRSFAMVFGTVIAGLLIGHLTQVHGHQGFAYAWIWQGVFQSIALVMLVIVYFYWKKLGADKFSVDDVQSLQVPSGESPRVR